MKYAIVKVINGNYFIHSEGITEVKAAKTQFHQLCASLWSASDVLTACAFIADENLDVVEGYKENINKNPHSEPEVKTERSSILPD